MNVSKELLEKAKQAKTADELQELAKAEGVELSEEEAARYFAELHKTGELEDDELDNVAGGGLCKDPYQSGDTPKFYVGQRVYVVDGGYTCYGKIDEVLPKQSGVFQYKINFDDGDICIFEERAINAAKA